MSLVIVIKIASHALVLVVSQVVQLVLLIKYLPLTKLALLMLLIAQTVVNFARHALKTHRPPILAISVPLEL